MDAHDALGLDAGQTEWIGLEQVVLGEERQARPVSGRADVPRLRAGHAPSPHGVGQDVAQGLAQTFERQPFQLFARQRLRPRVPS